MGRKSKAKFKLNGHTLPGINQKFETINLKDGRSPSSAFQMESPMKEENILQGANISPMGSYDYKETSKSNLPSFRDMFSLEQQQEAMKKWRDKRAEKKQNEIDDQKLKEEEEIRREQETIDETQGNVESTEEEFKTLAQEDQQEALESHLKPVELEMMDLPEEKAKNECPEGYHMVNGACVLTAEGKAYQERMNREKENQETTKPEVQDKLKEVNTNIKKGQLRNLNKMLKTPNLPEEKRAEIQSMIDQWNAKPY